MEEMKEMGGITGKIGFRVIFFFHSFLRGFLCIWKQSEIKGKSRIFFPKNFFLFSCFFFPVFEIIRENNTKKYFFWRVEGKKKIKKINYLDFVAEENSG